MDDLISHISPKSKLTTFLQYLQCFPTINSSQGFWTLLICSCFFIENESRKLTSLVNGHLQNYFGKNHTDCVQSTLSEDDIEKKNACVFD